MENELNSSNMNTIVSYLSGNSPLTGFGGSPSESELDFLTKNTIAGMAPEQAFNLASSAGMANTFFKPQELSQRKQMIERLQGMSR